MVCITENDSCSIDAIQVILGCSVGKGNLLFCLRGKQAFSFYSRKTGKSVRLLQKDKPEGMTRNQTMEYYRECSSEELFHIKHTNIELPEEANIFNSYRCELCGERTAENWLRVQGGKLVCLDCMKEYNRFDM